MKSLWGGYYGGGSISQIERFGDLSDVSTGIPAICEYTPRPVDIEGKKRGRYAEYHLSYCAYYIADLSQPLHSILYDEYKPSSKFDTVSPPIYLHISQ